MECIICCAGGGELKVVSRGVEKLKECSSIRQDKVYERIEHSEVVFVHEQCRKNYTRRVVIKADDTSTSEDRTTRSDSFNFKEHCLFCGDLATCDSKNPNKNISKVGTIGILETIKLQAINRNDDWGKQVTLRLSGIIDLVAAEGRYHRNCYQYFLKPECNIPKSIGKSVGRPADKDLSCLFNKLCNYIEENDECQFSLHELVDVMKKLEPNSPVYSEKHLKRKLQDFYGDAAVFTDVPGRSSVVCFSGYRDKILTNKWYDEKQSNSINERNRIVLMAAKIIREDIRCRAYKCDTYPTVEEIETGSSGLMPESLSIFMNEIIMPKHLLASAHTYRRKSLALQHCIVAAVRPRSFLSPIQIGLSVHLHRQFGSRLLIDILSNLGYCSTYKETLSYETSATLNNTTNNDTPGYVQYIFDNADHNTRTLDGYGSFHVMGGVKTVTPKCTMQNEIPLPRNVHSESTSAVEDLGYLPMIWYKQPSVVGFSKISAIDFTNLSIQLEPESAKNSKLLSLLWAVVFMNSFSTVNNPSWNGFMEAAHKYLPHEITDLVPLPFINNDPNNQSTIYTAMVCAAKESIRLQQQKVFVTFDQPLCHKAFEILLAAPPDSVLSHVEIRIGGFHLLMSFLGAIGMIMGGSGLEDMWNQVYAKNTVTHMLSGKQYSRAMRAHLLTQQALIRTIFDTCAEKQDIVHNLSDTFSDILEGNLLPDDVSECRDVQSLFAIIYAKLEELSHASRTSKLWAQYIEMVEIVHLYVRAERVGDWDLHLHCVQKMLPYFHAAGHFNYAKTAHIYLQRMLTLHESMPKEEFAQFVGKSYFTVKRTDKFWSGTWTDMIIEQFLMRSMKTTGGLTHGRGLSSSTLSKWVKAMPATVKVIDAMEKMAGVYSSTTSQHVELRESRRIRDKNDASKLHDWLKLHNPFETHSPLLICVTNGLVASPNVNCDSAKDIGIVGMRSMVGKPFHDIHLKRKDVVITISKSQKGVLIRDNLVEVNSSQLFHRMLCVVRSDEELATSLTYELASSPPALFENGCLRKGSGKSALVPVIETHLKPWDDLPSETTTYSYVIDGGYLLHKLNWQRHETYGEVVAKYTLYVKNTYPSSDITVVFDGYGKPSTKDHERFRRGCTSEVVVEENCFAVIPPDKFLLNSKNKTQLIMLFASHLRQSGVHVVEAEADADTLIVSKTVFKGSTDQHTVLVGEDTDLLVLLIAQSKKNTYMLIPNKGKRMRKVFDITRMQQSLGPMKDYILFIHAFTGCDTTSSIHGKGKLLPFRKINRDETLREKVSVFNNKSSSPQEVADAGEAFMCVLYGGEQKQNINDLRYQLYLKTVAKQKIDGNFKLSVLPPTAEATKQHSFRVYHQIQEWNYNAMQPTDWGWRIEHDHYQPIPTLMEPAPQSLLRLVTCNCKTGCDRRSCECLRNGLSCTDMCGYCSGFGCLNRLSVAGDEIDEDI